MADVTCLRMKILKAIDSSWINKKHTFLSILGSADNRDHFMAPHVLIYVLYLLGNQSQKMLMLCLGKCYPMSQGNLPKFVPALCFNVLFLHSVHLASSEWCGMG